MFQSILIPLDGSDGSEQAIPVAKAIAERFRSLITLVDVTPGVESRVTGLLEAFGASGTTAAADAREAAAEAAASAYLEAVREEHGGTGWGTAIGEGEAAEAIAACARVTGSDLIVMATHGRRGIRRLLMGSVAEEVVRKAGVAVLVVPIEDE